MNAHRWRNLQQAVAAQVDRVVLCTDTDAHRTGFPNTVVLPNSYTRPDRAAGDSHPGPGHPPVVLLQGTLTYPPNMDAVEWLIGRVAPRLWAEWPQVEIRLVGNPAPGVQRWNRPPAVTVVGRVPDMEPELARADLAVVPLRVGSGTRIKILESFAHRIPVVSTTLGAEGLEVEDGVHLLMADDPDDFAAACGRLLSDIGLRKRLVDAAERSVPGALPMVVGQGPHRPDRRLRWPAGEGGLILDAGGSACHHGGVMYAAAASPTNPAHALGAAPYLTANAPSRSPATS